MINCLTKLQLTKKNNEAILISVLLLFVFYAFSALLFEYRIFISKLKTQPSFQHNYDNENKNMNKDRT